MELVVGLCQHGSIHVGEMEGGLLALWNATHCSLPSTSARINSELDVSVPWSAN